MNHRVCIQLEWLTTVNFNSNFFGSVTKTLSDKKKCKRDYKSVHCSNHSAELPNFLVVGMKCEKSKKNGKKNITERLILGLLFFLALSFYVNIFLYTFMRQRHSERLVLREI